MEGNRVGTEWEQWLCGCPNTDDVYEYVKEFQLHIPLRNKLVFDGAIIPFKPQSSIVVNDVNNAIYRAQPCCVRMGGRKRRASKVALQRCDNVQDNAEVENRDKSKSKLVHMFFSFLTCIISFK
jgi:hypothetical protein